MTESLFTNRRGSPNTLTFKEAQEEEQTQQRISDLNGRKSAGVGLSSGPRVLSFKEKNTKPSMSLQKNLSLI